MYVIEVVKKTSENKIYKNTLGKHEHVGYMKVKFKTKEEAYQYYDINNKHMRPINLYDTGISDIDPKTNLAYIVRRDCDIVETIDPFY